MSKLRELIFEQNSTYMFSCYLTTSSSINKQRKYDEDTLAAVFIQTFSQFYPIKPIFFGKTGVCTVIGKDRRSGWMGMNHLNLRRNKKTAEKD